MREQQRGGIISFISSGIKDFSVLRAMEIARRAGASAGIESGPESMIRLEELSKDERTTARLAKGFRTREKVGEQDTYSEQELLRLGKEYPSYDDLLAVISQLALDEQKKEQCKQYIDKGNRHITETFYDFAKAEKEEQEESGRGRASRRPFNFVAVLREEMVFPPRVGKNLTKQADLLEERVLALRASIICQPATENVKLSIEGLPVRYDIPYDDITDLLKEAGKIVSPEDRIAMKKGLVPKSIVQHLADLNLSLKSIIQRIIYDRMPKQESKNKPPQDARFLGSTYNDPARCVFVSLIAVIDVSKAQYLTAESAIRKGLPLPGATSAMQKIVVIDDITIHPAPRAAGKTGTSRNFVVYRAKDFSNDQIDTVLRNVHGVAVSYSSQTNRPEFYNIDREETKDLFVFSRQNCLEYAFREVPFAVKASEVTKERRENLLAGYLIAWNFLQRKEPAPPVAQFWDETLIPLLGRFILKYDKIMDPQKWDTLIRYAVRGLDAALERVSRVMPRYYEEYALLSNDIEKGIKDAAKEDENYTTEKESGKIEDILKIVYLTALNVINTNPGYLSGIGRGTLLSAVESEEVPALKKQNLSVAYKSGYPIQDWIRHVLPYTGDVSVTPRPLTSQGKQAVESALEALAVEYLANRMKFARDPIGLREMKFTQNLLDKPLRFTAPGAYSPPPSQLQRGVSSAASSDTRDAKVISLPMNRPNFSLDWFGLVFDIVKKNASTVKKTYNLNSLLSYIRVGQARVSEAQVHILDTAAAKFGVESPFEPAITQAERVERLRRLRETIAEAQIMPTEEFKPAGLKEGSVHVGKECAVVALAPNRGSRYSASPLICLST
jgi:hypothetical protein